MHAASARITIVFWGILSNPKKLGFNPACKLIATGSGLRKGSATGNSTAGLLAGA